MVWPFRSGKGAAEPKDDSKKRKLEDQNEVPVKIAGGIGQARLSRLNTGEKYRLTISNHLTTKIIGGQVGSFRVTGETLTIQDLNNNVVFSGELGDLITVQDEHGQSTAIAEVGAGSRTETRVEITKANMLETTYNYPRATPQLIVENIPNIPVVQRTQSAQIELPVATLMERQAQMELPPVMEMQGHDVNTISDAVNPGMAFNGNTMFAGNLQGAQERVQGGLMGQNLDRHAQFLRVYNQLAAQRMDVTNSETPAPTTSQVSPLALGQEEDTDALYE